VYIGNHLGSGLEKALPVAHHTISQWQSVRAVSPGSTKLELPILLVCSL
jgi:hypothetical protein